MKVYTQSIILGVLSILSGLLMVGIPWGSEMIEIVNLAVIAIGAFAIILLGVFKKKYTLAVILSVIYLAAVFAMTAIIEGNKMDYSYMLYIGFVPGLTMAATGMITSIQQKGKRKILAGMIITSIGMLINAASCIMGVIALITGSAAI